MLSIKKVTIMSATIALSGVGVAAVASSATGAAPASPHVAVLTQSAKSPLSTDAQRVLASSSFADVHPDADASRAVPAPTGAQGSWYLVPTDDGACLAVGGSAVCGDAATVNGGTLTLVELGMTAGRPDPTKAVINAVAPDGVTGARIVAPDGSVTSTAPVANNVYRLTGSLPAGSSVELTGSGGVTKARFGG
jgi:hypothetical protein